MPLPMAKGFVSGITGAHSESLSTLGVVAFRTVGFQQQ